MEHQATRKRRWSVIAAYGVLALLVLYPLSLGPAYWWQHSSGNQTVPLIYAPLVHYTSVNPNVLGWWSSYASWGVSDNGKRFGCAPLLRDGLHEGPRALSWHDVTASPFNKPR